MHFALKKEKNVQDDMVLMTRIVALTPISIVVTSLDGKIYYSNTYAQQVLQQSREQLQGANFGDFFSDTGGGTAWKELLDIVAHEGSCNRRVSMVRNDGNDLICIMDAFKSANNTLFHIVLLFKKT